MIDDFLKLLVPQLAFTADESTPVRGISFMGLNVRRIIRGFNFLNDINVYY